MKKSMEPATRALEAIRGRWLKELAELQSKVKEKQEDISALDALISAAKGTKKADAAQSQSIS